MILALAGIAGAAGAAYFGDESVNPLYSSPVGVEITSVAEFPHETQPGYPGEGSSGALTLSDIVESEVDRPGPAERSFTFEGVDYTIEIYPVTATGENAALLRTQDGQLVAAYQPDPRYGGFVDYRELRDPSYPDAASDRDLLAHDLGPDGLGRFVAHAMAIEARADIGIINFSALKGHIPAGAVSSGVVARALPYSDPIVLVRLSGSQLAELRQDAVTEPRRLAIAALDGSDPLEQLVPDRIYTVAVSEYLFDPRAGFPVFQNTMRIGGVECTARDAVFRRFGGASRIIDMPRAE